jgi:acyl-CoA thioester hydrolase
MTLKYLTQLTAQDQQDQGLPHVFPVAFADKVRFSEIDSQNHVNNKAYFEWFERARTHLFADHMLPLFSGTGTRPGVGEHSASIRYHKEMLIGESYIVTARVSEFRNTSVTIEQLVWSDDLRASMSAVLVLLDPGGSGAKFPLPDFLRQHFIDVDGAKDSR